MSLKENKIGDLWETPTSPQLLTLFLNINPLSMISGDLFQFKPCLKVLGLSNSPCLEKLPPRISRLVSLSIIEWHPRIAKGVGLLVECCMFELREHIMTPHNSSTTNI